MNTKNNPDREEVIKAFQEYRKALDSRTHLTLMECRSLDGWLSSALQLLERDGEILENIREMCIDAADGKWPHKEACKVISATCTHALASTSTTEEESA